MHWGVFLGGVCAGILLAAVCLGSWYYWQQNRNDERNLLHDIVSDEQSCELEATTRLKRVVDYFDTAWATPVQREPFINGLKLFTDVLEHLQKDLGTKIRDNIEKLESFKGDERKSNYRDWLWDELSLHREKNQGKSYVDPSAWMGNLWLGLILEFFVEMFDNMANKGSEPSDAARKALSDTQLSKKFSYLQRRLFESAFWKLPSKNLLYDKLRRGASREALERDMIAFVGSGRELARFCLRTDKELEALMKGQEVSDSVSDYRRYHSEPAGQVSDSVRDYRRSHTEPGQGCTIH